MAYVETNDGQVADTYPDDYSGGIWKVNILLLFQNLLQNAIYSAYGSFVTSW